MSQTTANIAAAATIRNAADRISRQEGISFQDALDGIVAGDHTLPDHAMPAWRTLCRNADMAMSQAGSLIGDVADMMRCDATAAAALIWDSLIIAQLERHAPSYALREWEDGVRRRRAA